MGGGGFEGSSRRCNTRPVILNPSVAVIVLCRPPPGWEIGCEGQLSVQQNKKTPVGKRRET